MGVYSENVVNTPPSQACLNTRLTENARFILCDKSKAAVYPNEWLLHTTSVCQCIGSFPNSESIEKQNHSAEDDTCREKIEQCTCDLSQRTWLHQQQAYFKLSDPVIVYCNRTDSKTNCAGAKQSSTPSENTPGKREQRGSISCNCDEAVIFVACLLKSRQNI